MDDAHLWAATRYVELNPIAADMVTDPLDWPWSSAHTHLKKTADANIKLAASPDLTDDWASYLASGISETDNDLVEQHLRTGRPLGDEAFIDRAERKLGRTLRRQKPGPKPNQ